MPLFTWDNKYSVNNAELDNHHKILFIIINRLYDVCLDTDKPNCLEPIVEELVSYSNYHFTAEEEYMRNVGYKEIDRHISEHRLFIQRALKFQEAVNKNDIELIKGLIVFLGEWLLHHVMEEDKKYSINLNVY